MHLAERRLTKRSGETERHVILALNKFPKAGGKISCLFPFAFLFDHNCFMKICAFNSLLRKMILESSKAMSCNFSCNLLRNSALN